MYALYLLSPHCVFTATAAMGESPERQYAIGVLCITLPSLAVALRICARRRTKSKLLGDDWMIVIALLRRFLLFAPIALTTLIT